MYTIVQLLSQRFVRIYHFVHVHLRKIHAQSTIGYDETHLKAKEFPFVVINFFFNCK